MNKIPWVNWIHAAWVPTTKNIIVYQFIPKSKKRKSFIPPLLFNGYVKFDYDNET